MSAHLPGNGVLSCRIRLRPLAYEVTSPASGIRYLVSGIRYLYALTGIIYAIILCIDVQINEDDAKHR